VANSICSVEGCERPESARGWCKAHHNRWLRHGDVRAHIPVQGKWSRNPDGKCSVAGCGGKQRARGWCTFHYGRWQKYGDVRADVPRKKGTGYINKAGYRLIWHDGKQLMEHRVVMERILGRALLPDENVHHMNGIRLDNRPENLELWASSQPPGQRVVDLVAWAREIIDRYDDYVQIAA